MGDYIGENVMSGTCSEYGGEVICIQGLVGKLRGRDHLGDPGVNGRITLRRIFRNFDVGLWTVLTWVRTGRDSGDL